MTERGFDTSYWTDPFVRKLNAHGKLLYSYLWTNDHCNQAGVYEIDIETIAFETRLSEEELPELLLLLEPKVKWFQDKDIVWVKNFLCHQAKSPKFLIAAAKCLKKLNSNGISSEVVGFNLERHSISIPYPYTNDSVGILSDSVSVSKSSSNSIKKKRVVKGEGGSKKKEITPTSESEIEESLSQGDREIILVWRSVKGFGLSWRDCAELVVRLRTRFPDVNIHEQSEAWAARKLSEPLVAKSRPSGQIWNWMVNAREFKHEAKTKTRRVDGGRPKADFTGDW